MGNVLVPTLLLFVLPLGVDTFGIAAAVGASRPSGLTRWRISLLFVIFEAGMPLLGLILGASVGNMVGSIADYLSGGLLILLGGYLWWADDDDDVEAARARRLTGAHGLALVGLALSISLDELAIGFSLGIDTNLAIPATTVAVIAAQTLVASQLGLSLGARISERWRGGIERLAVPILIILGVYLLAGAPLRIGLVTGRDALVVGILVVILGTVTVSCRRGSRQSLRRHHETTEVS